jgi:hypothetical protein
VSLIENWFMRDAVFLKSPSLTILYRSKVLRFLCLVIFIATGSKMPALTLITNIPNGDDSRRSTSTLHDMRRQTVPISHVNRRGYGVAIVLGALLFAEVCFAQSAPSSNGPLRITPTEKFAVNARVRD